MIYQSADGQKTVHEMSPRSVNRTATKSASATMFFNGEIDRQSIDQLTPNRHNLFHFVLAFNALDHSIRGE